MPPTYKYGFLPKNREKALEIALTEFYECRKQAKKIEQEAKALNARMDFLKVLLDYGVGAGWPEGEMLDRLKATIGEKS